MKASLTQTIRGARKRAGFSLLETVVSIAVGVMLITAFVSLVVQSAHMSRLSTDKLKAHGYLVEAIEVAKTLERQSNFSANFPVSCTATTPCHPKLVTVSTLTTWQFASGEQVLEGGRFIRRVVIEPVYRDGSNRITTPALGTLDPFTKKIVATVVITSAPGAPTLMLETYVYRHRP